MSDAWIEGEAGARWRSAAALGPGNGADESGASLLEVEPGCRLPRHTDSAEEILYVDVYLNGKPRPTVEANGHDIATLVSAVAGRRHTKVSVADLARRHVRARGATLVDEPEQATITFGTSADSTYDVLHPEKLLADLL